MPGISTETSWSQLLIFLCVSNNERLIRHINGWFPLRTRLLAILEVILSIVDTVAFIANLHFTIV